MKVADLKQHLADLAKLIESSGSKTFAKDMAAAADALTPFADQSLAEFGRLLALAHEYHTTGKLTPPPKPPRAARKPAKEKANPEEVAATIRQLYDRSGDLTLTMEQIDADLARTTGLNKNGLLMLCERMELAGMKSKSMGAIRDAIRQKVLDRRSSAQREEMIHTASPAEQPVPQTPEGTIP